MRHLARFRVLATLAAVLVLAGAVALVVGLDSQHHAPQPPPSAAGSYAIHSPAAGSPQPTTQAPDPSPRGPVLASSRPVRLQIPRIGVDADLMTLGLNKDKTIQVPPLSKNSKPGWYRYSPTPGALGPAVILGHVDSAAYGAAVFYKLGALRKGNTVDVTRADHTVAVFRIDAVASYSKTDFPSITVYGNTDNAALRLITCGGSFDSATHNYLNNIVVFASLVSSHRA